MKFCFKSLHVAFRFQKPATQNTPVGQCRAHGGKKLKERRGKESRAFTAKGKYKSFAQPPPEKQHSIVSIFSGCMYNMGAVGGGGGAGLADKSEEHMSGGGGGSGGMGGGGGGHMGHGGGGGGGSPADGLPGKTI